MEVLYNFISPSERCSYLGDRPSRMRYVLIRDLSTAEYGQLMHQRWRRFGHTLFRPECESCTQCLPLRIPVATFTKSRSQQRTAKANRGVIRLEINPPSIDESKLALYERYHSFQMVHRDWPDRQTTASEYAESFVQNPFPMEEWSYWIDDRLIGVGLVDALPVGLSAIYFYYDPDERERSLGTWNVLSLLEEAGKRNLPHVYLGYYVQGCQSLEYKANFKPNEILDPVTREWIPWQSRD